MKNTQYLYGIEPKELENKLYFEALRHKRDSGVRLYRKLFLDHDKTEEAHIQMFYVAKALKHTEKLIEEITA